MNDQLLKDLWKSGNFISRSDEELLSLTRGLMDDFNRRVAARNTRETTLAWIMIPVFAVIAYLVPPVLSKIGALMIAPACLLIIYKLRSTKKPSGIDHSDSLLRFLIQYKTYMLKEQKLLKSTMVWYALPISISIAMFFIGLGNYILAVTSLLSAPFIHLMNVKASSMIDPLIQKLDEAIISLKPG